MTPHDITRDEDPSVRQRRAADPGASVWVGASAGTGKTKVLTDRVLRLMLAGTDPQRILCLTFTKAAAAEMANRIAGRLSQWAVLPDDRLSMALHDLTGVEPRGEQVTAARRLFARVLDTPGGMKIQTIHAFCQSMLRRFPLEAGLPPNFEVMDDRTAAELQADARTEVLERARAGGPLGEAVALLAGAVSEEDFGALLTTLTAKRGRVKRLVMRHGGTDRLIAAVHRHLKVAPGETVADVIQAACAAGAFDDAGLRSACRALAGSGKTDVERGIGIQRWLDGATLRVDGFEAYTGWFLTAEGAVRKQLLGKKAAEGDPSALKALEEEAARLVAVLDRVRTVKTARATAALLTVADAILAAYESHKAARAQLDFDDLILAAARLLAEDSRANARAWVLYKLDGGLDHILVDEAQDTNPDQWRVVAALAEEFFAGQGAAVGRTRTLFVVGDDKQSIFSFQRADPAEFARMRAHFGARVQGAELRWEPVQLQVSFRSVGAVLKAVDAVFARAAARDGVADPEVEVRHTPFRRRMAGTVEVWPLVEEDDRLEPDRWALPLEPERQEKPVARLARVTAAQIAQWLRTGETLPARGRKVRPGDIMVLVRRRNAFVQHLVRTLKELHVPVAGVDRMVLTEQLAVMDLMALGRFLLLPDDDLTLATVLKGPLIGLSEDGLFQLAHGRGRASLWSALSRLAREDAAFAPAHDWLAALLAVTDYRAPFELFAGVLTRPCPADGEGSGRRAMLARLGSEAVDPLDEFMAATLSFERENVPSLQGFLTWLTASEAEVKRELDSGGGPGGGRVRVMTVHGSKGLQAPIVIMPDTTGVPDLKQRVFWPDTDDGVPLFAPRVDDEDGACRAARALARQRQEQEYRRLLYVALTRAEDRLVVCGWRDRKNAAKPECWYGLVRDALSDLADRRGFDFTLVSPAGWDGDGLVLSEPQATEPKSDDLDLAPPATASAGLVEPWMREPAPEDGEPTRPLTPSRPSGDEPAVRSPLGRDDGHRFKRGTLIHKLLQVLPELPPDRWAGATAAWLARPTHGFSADEQAEIAAETLRVLVDPTFAPLFGPGSRAEVPVVGLVGGRTLSGQIDRLLVAEDAVWIIDYKTNRPPPRVAADVSPVYVAQMAAYRAALSRIYPGRPVRCVLLWTDGPFLMELEQPLLDAHAPG